VDEAFLEEIEKWRERLARNLALRNSRLSVRDLNAAVQRTIQFLEGHTGELVGRLRRDMETAAEELRFEAAAKLRDRIAAVEQATGPARPPAPEARDAAHRPAHCPDFPPPGAAHAPSHRLSP
jgi:hypothetical protein